MQIRRRLIALRYVTVLLVWRGLERCYRQPHSAHMNPRATRMSQR